MAILITGGTGFLGRHLTRHLVQSGENVVILDTVPNRQVVADVADQVKVLQGDVMEVTALMDVIQRNKIEGVIHLAYYLGTGGIRNPLPSINVNCIGTTHIFEAARLSGLKRVVYMSSVAVFPERTANTAQELSEDDPPAPSTSNQAGLYGACKLFNEHTADYYNHAYGMDFIAIRPTSVFGEGRGPTPGGGGGSFYGGPGTGLTRQAGRHAAGRADCRLAVRGRCRGGLSPGVSPRKPAIPRVQHGRSQPQDGRDYGLSARAGCPPPTSQSVINP